tara:strand:+ start:4794 stop:5948 length:1155 start_codon:yes stop_codon:yes gene_type:complete
MFNQRRLYPDDLYDDLYDAGLIGDGKVIVLAKIQNAVVERRESGSNTWKEVTMPVFDQTHTAQVFVPVIDQNTGLVMGDWRRGLTSEQIKRINEEANVPIYSADDDSPIMVTHQMELDLANPIHKSKFEILKHNDGIALSNESITEDQEFYFYSPKQEKRNREKELQTKQLAVNLISELAQKGKEEILLLMKYEKQLYISPAATAEDKLLLFQELCWEQPKDIVEIHAMQKKTSRIMLRVLVEHAVLYSNNPFGPFYRPSNVDGQEYGEMIGENVDEAIKNIGRPENADLQRAYTSIVEGKYNPENPLLGTIQSEMTGYSNLLENIQERAEYELPVKITNAWIRRTSKSGLLAYLKHKEVENVSETTSNKKLRELALEIYSKDK